MPKLSQKLCLCAPKQHACSYAFFILTFNNIYRVSEFKLIWCGMAEFCKLAVICVLLITLPECDLTQKQTTTVTRKEKPNNNN